MKFKKIKSRIIAISLAMASVATPLTASSLAPPVMAADTFTGIKNGVYYENGKVTGKKNGFILTTYNGKKAYWNIRNSKLVKGPTVAKGVDWWYVDKEGKVDKTFTGLAKNSNGIWYCENGYVSQKKDDIIQTTYNKTNAWYNIRKSKLTPGTATNNVYQNKYGW